jgi:hypothetical protein
MQGQIRVVSREEENANTKPTEATEAPTKPTAETKPAPVTEATEAPTKAPVDTNPEEDTKPAPVTEATKAPTKPKTTTEEPKTKPEPTKEPTFCCEALTAECMACSAGVSVKEFCMEEPKVMGCPKKTTTAEPKTKPEFNCEEICRPTPCAAPPQNCDYFDPPFHPQCACVTGCGTLMYVARVFHTVPPCSKFCMISP